MTNKTIKSIVLFALFLLPLATAANLGYWGGTATLDGNQVNDSHVVSIWADNTKLREDTLGTGPEVPPEYYLLVAEEAEGKGKDINFKLKPTAQSDACTLLANESPRNWSLGAHTLQLNFEKLADGSSAACSFQCSSGNFCGTTAQCGTCPPVIQTTTGGGGGGSGCAGDWVCENWGECLDGTQTRECSTTNNCNSLFNKPELTQTCEVILETTTPETENTQGDTGGEEGTGTGTNGAGTDGDNPSGLAGITGAAITDTTGGNSNIWIGTGIVVFIVILGGVVYWQIWGKK